MSDSSNDQLAEAVSLITDYRPLIPVFGRPGGYSGEPEPDPIPNSAVKLSCANGTKSRRLGRVGRCQACQGQEPGLRYQSSVVRAQLSELSCQSSGIRARVLELRTGPASNTPLHDHSITLEPNASGIDAGWSSPVARQAHNLKVVGSNPTPATK